MAKEKRKSVFDENLDSEYIGNVFGWKTSIIGLVVIAGFVALYMLLEQQNKNTSPTIEKQEYINTDSTSVINQSDTLK